MGQVPHSTNGIAPYGIAGDGRLARHFSHYFNLLGIPYRSWSRRKQAEQGLTFAESLVDSFEGCQTILVLLSDQAIEPWIRQAAPVLAGAGKALSGEMPPRFYVHCSGALVTGLAQGMHPLMSFGAGFYDRAEYERIPFVCEEGAPDHAAAKSFREVFPKLPNPHYTVPAEQKAFYHALCVMSGNFTVLLWQKMFADLGKLGIPADAALPYLERIAGNLKQNPAAALTGPLARGDRETISKNLEALAGDRYQPVYEAFLKAYEKGPRA